MPGRSLRLWLPAGLLGAGCLLLLLARQQQVMPLAQPLEAVVPDTLLGLGSWDREIDPAEQRIAGMDSYVMRYFAAEPEPAWDFSVYVGYYQSQTQGKSIHSPKNCLPGAGWEAVSSSAVTVEAGGEVFTVNRYLLASRTSRALVYYWYQGRGRVSWNEYAVKWSLLRDKATLGRSEEALVRVVVPIRAGTTEEAADAVAQAAASRLIPAVFAALPPLEGGRGEALALLP